MNLASRRKRVLSVIAASVLATLASSVPARAQSEGSTYDGPAFGVPFNKEGRVAAPEALTIGGHGYHIFPARTEVGQHTPLNGPAVNFQGQASSGAALKVKPLAGLPKPGFFPADLSYFGGLVGRQISSANVYYNCPNESCWGDPEGFLKDLAGSKFIHILDQYIGLKTNNRYPFDASATVLESGPGGTLNNAAIENLVHGAASQVGINHIFHVFLPQGVDVCPDAGVCYSPDNPNNFALCAYHSSVTFGDIGTVAYTVQPFQDVPGCEVAGPWPHSQLIDSTNSTLSHELFETITDPFSDQPSWVADNSQPEEGNEVADICHGVGDGNGAGIVPTFTLVKGRNYELQLEYANSKHGCVIAP